MDSNNMVARPNVSKYSPPNLPAIVQRSRLTERLQADPNQHLVLVIGQAAQGKTTLVASHFTCHKTPMAWLHLAPQDGDSANFYHLLVCALSQSLPEEELEEYAEQGHIAMGTSTATVRYEASLRSIWKRLPDDLVIVLDGLEQIPKDDAAHSLIQLMITLAADKGRVIIISRQMPPYKLQQWMMRRQILVMDNSELAFTQEEIITYFETIHGYGLSPQRAEDLLKVTGGWVGGLVLVSQALIRHSPDHWQSFLNEHLPESLADDAWPYFAEEIFDGQPAQIQNLLMKAALVEEIDPIILSPLFEGMEFQAVLDDLVSNHLFIQVIHDDRQRSLYRLNHLFQSFLRSQFKKRLKRKERHRVYEQIAERYLDQRQAEVAVKYFIKAENLTATVYSIKRVGIDLVIRGRFADLEIALSALPEDLIKSDPWLFFLLTLTRRIKGGLRNIEDFHAATTAFEKQNDTRGHMLAMAYLIEAQVFAGNDPAECENWIQKAENLLATRNNIPYFSFARAMLWLQIGFGCIASGLDLSKGASACRNAYLLAHKINDPRLMANANIVSVLGLTLRGDFIRADEALEKMSSFADTDAYTEYHTLRRLVNAELALYRGNLKSAQKQLAPLANEIEKFGMLFLYPTYVDNMGLIQIYRQKFDTARDTCRHLLDVATLSGNTYYEGLSYRLNAMRHYFQGRHYDAIAASQRALELLHRDGNPSLHWMRTLQLTALIQIHLQRHDQAETGLKETRHYFSKTANLLSMSETYLSLALLAHAQKEDEKCIRYLSEGFAIASERQYDHFLIICPSDIEKCCRLAMNGLDKSQTAWPEHLLAHLTRAQKIADAAPKPSGTNADIVTRSANFTERYLEIRTLGEFRVLLNGKIPIEDKQWGGNRTKLLLKAIVVHGIQDIPKDIIVEDIWPESNSRSANQNFKVTLHRLRKILEPELSKHDRSSFIHLKNSLVSLDKTQCWVDVQSFLSCCKDIKRAALTKETQTILSLGEQVIELYQGDFLPEDPYTPWVEMKRLALKDEYIATLMIMTDIYREQERLEKAVQCCKTLITADACLEKANADLMQLYILQGRKNDAVKVYEQLHAALENELSVQPDPVITELYRQIRNR